MPLLFISPIYCTLDNTNIGNTVMEYTIYGYNILMMSYCFSFRPVSSTLLEETLFLPGLFLPGFFHLRKKPANPKIYTFYNKKIKKCFVIAWSYR